MAVGPIVRRRREDLDLSQGRLARLAGLSQGYLSKIEKGSVKSPGVGSLHSLAAVLDIDPERLLREAGYPTNGRRHNSAGRVSEGLSAWTSWQSLPPCLSMHQGWVCHACRQWPQSYRFSLPARFTP